MGEGVGARCWFGHWLLGPAFLLSEPQDQGAGPGSPQSLHGSASFPHRSQLSLAGWVRAPFPPLCAGRLCLAPRSARHLEQDVNGIVRGTHLAPGRPPFPPGFGAI